VLPAYLVFTAVVLALAFIDLDTKRLPNVLVLPLYPVALVGLGLPALVYGQGHAALRAAIGGAALYAFYFVLCFATAGKGLGFGDVKLAGVLGLFLGWLGGRDVLVGALAGIFVGGLVAVVLLLRGAGRKAQVPFGPFLVVGALIGIFAGHPIAHAWLGSA
jgi:leader peptidase (prepilin peptidase)/N-methyltransferase